MLPGGENLGSVTEFANQLHKTYNWLPKELVQRYSRSYGCLCYRLIGKASSLRDLGEHFGAGLYAAEVDYLICNEWAYTPEDILWRRSKLGLSLEGLALHRFTKYMSERLPRLVPHRFAQPEAPLGQVV